MARRGNCRSKRKGRDQLDGKCSDDSDEDYKVGEDEEFNESEDEYCSSLAEDESEESLAGSQYEEEEEWIEKKVRLPARPRGRKVFQGKKKNGVVKPKRKKVVTYSDEEEDDDSDDDFAITKGRTKRRVLYKEEDKEEEEEEEEVDIDNYQKSRKKMVSYKEGNDNFDDEIPKTEKKFSNREEKDDVDYDDMNDDDDDEEFLPDEIDDINDEDESPVFKKNKMGRASMVEKGIDKGRRRGRNAKIMKNNKRKKLMKKQRPKRKVRSDGDDDQIIQKNKIIEHGRSRRRKTTLNSDSDFVISGSSDYEYTISEEEREQIREASEFCRGLRGSNLNLMEGSLILPQQGKRAVRKGKGKVESIEVEAGNQVCGICLSEEGKRTIRGTLNCCSHYFCFACIMEWSKVESRCPLCKQRFSTISRTARADAGLALRTQVITVPERDQVYQPSEEERRGYLDPYENVLCMECQQGGDDALMLLCDLCDSPAHTYCVGLGREVPEGNWYCDGCRPTALASSSALGLNSTVDHGATNNMTVGSSPVASVRETFDLNELYVPDIPLSQGTELSLSPRQSVGNFPAASPASGTGAATVFERRRIQRQIYQFLNYRSRQSDRSDGMARVSGNNLVGTQVGGGRELASAYTNTPTRMAPQNIYLQGSIQDDTTLPLHSREVFSPRFSNLRGQSLHNQASTSANHSFGGLSPNDFVGINSRVGLGQGHQQLHPCSSRSDISTDVSLSPYQYREATAPSRTLQGSLRTPF